MKTETLEWYEPVEQLPDDNVTVLGLQLRTGEPLLVHHDDEIWIDADSGEQVEIELWAEVKGP